MAPLLVGTAATAGVAATTGLIGTAGAVTVAGAATAAGIGLGVAGAIQQGRAIETQAKSARNIAEFNAQVEKQEAAARRQRATFAQRRQAREAARIKSGLTVDIAKAGGLGSPVAEDLAAEQAE